MNGISKLTDGSGATNPNSLHGLSAVVNQLGRGANQGRHSKGHLEHHQLMVLVDVRM